MTDRVFQGLVIGLLTLIYGELLSSVLAAIVSVAGVAVLVATVLLCLDDIKGMLK